MPHPYSSRNTIVVPVSDAEWMSSNDRRHWAATAKRTRALRTKSALLARTLTPVKGVALVTAFIAYPRAGRADPGNAAPTVKAILDGITDARIWVDDDHEHVIGPDYRRDPDTKTKGLHQVRIVITDQHVPS